VDDQDVQFLSVLAIPDGHEVQLHGSVELEPGFADPFIRIVRNLLTVPRLTMSDFSVFQDTVSLESFLKVGEDY